MKLTEKARDDLEAYLRKVRRSLADDPAVDPDHVVEGIREHVAAALEDLNAEPATAEEVADVLERLGSPAQWGDATSTFGAAEAGAAPARRSHPSASRELAPLILAGLGGILLLAELAVPLGWGLLATGALTARIVIRSRPPDAAGDSPLEGLTSLLWHVSAVAFATVLVLLPAILVWSQSQTGGALEPFLFEHTLPPGGTADTPVRPDGYWPLVGLLAAAASGGWWLLLALLVRSRRGQIQDALAPARYVAAPPVLRGLLWAGGLLLVLSLLLLAGALG